MSMIFCPGSYSRNYHRRRGKGKVTAACNHCAQRVPLQTNPSPKDEGLVLAKHAKPEEVKP